jgi:hypothetical protein
MQGIRRNGRRSYLLGNERIRKRNIRKNIRGRPFIRTPRNPVRVVFVCWYGTTSDFFAENFQEILNRARIGKQVRCDFVALHRLLRGDKIPNPFLTADIVVPVRGLSKSDYKYIKQQSSKRAVVYPPLNPFFSRHTDLLGFIKKRYRFSNKEA